METLRESLSVSHTSDRWCVSQPQAAGDENKWESVGGGGAEDTAWGSRLILTFDWMKADSWLASSPTNQGVCFDFREREGETPREKDERKGETERGSLCDSCHSCSITSTHTHTHTHTHTVMRPGAVCYRNMLSCVTCEQWLMCFQSIWRDSLMSSHDTGTHTHTHTHTQQMIWVHFRCVL